MFCPNCGNKLNDEEDFCTNCGTNINEVKEKISQIDENNLKESNNVISNKNNIKEFFVKYKKQEIIILSSVILVFICVFVYRGIFSSNKVNNETLSWNTKYEDLKLDYIKPSKVTLGFNLPDNWDLNNIEISNTCGEFTNEGTEILWNLSNADGTCEINVKYKDKSINKTYKVISFDNNNLALDFKIDEDSNEDLDLDGLTNKQEKEYGTSIELYDTDMDGLSDYDEIFVYKTDPLKKDTDNDGINDYDEIELGLDPLKQDSKNDGIKDGDRTLKYNYTLDNIGISLDITGKGNISTLNINSFKSSTFENMRGVLDTVYSFYTEGKIDNADVKIKYSIDDIKSKKLNEKNLSLYYFDEKNKSFEKISSTVDTKNKVVMASLKHFSKYVIADTGQFSTLKEAKVMFTIDNSISMYSETQMKNAGYLDTVGAAGNDVLFKRLSLTNKMIDMFGVGYQFGVAEFSGDYVELSDFTTVSTEAKNAVNSIKSNWNSNMDGTDIVNALLKSMYKFEKNDKEVNYMVLLTDGKDTGRGNLDFTKKLIVANALERDLKICIIGLGNSVDTDELTYIAENTGCSYYNASDSNALDEIYARIAADINYNLVDIDGDGKVDGVLIADSGFIVNRDGFSFRNYSTNLSTGGHCFGMATFAELYYTKKLPLSFRQNEIKNQKSYAYDLNNTYFASYSNLYDYKLRTNVLKHTFEFDAFDEEQPKPYRVVNGNNYIFNSKSRKEMDGTGFYDITLKDMNLIASKKEQIEFLGKVLDKYEEALLNEDKMQNSDKIENSDKQLLNAIYAAFIKQDATEFYSSSSNLLMAARNLFGIESSKKINSAVFIELLKMRLNDKDAPLLFSGFEGGLHAVNAIDLVQSLDNANHYYIGIYDNNYPGEKRYVDMECTKTSCVTKKGKFYSGNNKPIRISKSLADDLKFYK